MNMSIEEQTLEVFPSADELAESLAKQLMSLSKAGTVAHVCLSGGTTPKHVFGYIAHSHYASKIEWSKLHFWWGDERCVPATDEQSNYGEAMRLLFSHVLIPAENLHPIHGELSPEKACIEFKDEMAANLPFVDTTFGRRPAFDWMLLGLGTDGHTASLFPGQVDYEAAQNAVIANQPETSQARVSLSAPVICAAHKVTFLATGAEKKALVTAIIEGDPLAEAYPAANIFAQLVASKGRVEWYVDQVAAPQ